MSDKTKMTIHRALSELKLIDSKIDKKISRFSGATLANHKGETMMVVGTKDDWIKSNKEIFQSVQDLIKRKTKIKTAIVKSNAETEVTIADEIMTVADAITMKDFITSKQQLLDIMDRQDVTIRANANKHNSEVDIRAKEVAERAAGGEGSNADNINKVAEMYKENNSVQVVYFDDNFGQIKEELETSIIDFQSEVDAVLSESNATTEITI